MPELVFATDNDVWITSVEWKTRHVRHARFTRITACGRRAARVYRDGVYVSVWLRAPDTMRVCGGCTGTRSWKKTVQPSSTS